MHRSHRRLLLVLGAVVAAAVLSGCVNLTSFTGSQQTPIGGVQITSVICRSNTSGCSSAV